MTDESLGRQISQAKPVRLTFYDMLGDVPFTTTFYVRDDVPHARIEALIEAIRAVTPCVLGKYKIGYEEYQVPDYREQLKGLPEPTMGGQRWVIKYRTEQGWARSFSIPGRDPSLSINAQRSPIGKKGKAPDSALPQWQRLVALIKEICVSEEGHAPAGRIGLDYRNEKWPPKRARRRSDIK